MHLTVDDYVQRNAPELDSLSICQFYLPGQPAQFSRQWVWKRLGLGPQRVPTLGSTIFDAIEFGALSLNMWWWWGSPDDFALADVCRLIPDKSRS